MSAGEEYGNAGGSPGPEGDGELSADPGGRDPAQFAGTSLRLQVLEIIAGLLNSTAPDLTEVRSRLRNFVKEHPWDPELALLMHLSIAQQDMAAVKAVLSPATQPPAAPAAVLAPEAAADECPG